MEFTVAPSYPGRRGAAGEPRVAHRVPDPSRKNRQEFARIIDETPIALNADYRTKRTGVGMVAPTITALPTGTFHRWMRAGGKLGDQHKVPRATNDRAIADALLALAPATSRARRARGVLANRAG